MTRAINILSLFEADQRSYRDFFHEKRKVVVLYVILQHLKVNADYVRVELLPDLLHELLQELHLEHIEENLVHTHMKNMAIFVFQPSQLKKAQHAARILENYMKEAHDLYDPSFAILLRYNTIDPAIDGVNNAIKNYLRNLLKHEKEEEIPF